MSELIGVAAVAKGDVWAIGTNSDVFPGENPFAEHWNGQAWRIVKLPPSGCSNRTGSPALNSVTRVPGTHQLWAVGWCDVDADVPRRDTLVYHYVAGAWHRAPSPNPRTFNTLLGVTATGRTDAWAVGWSSTEMFPHTRPLVLHHSA